VLLVVPKGLTLALASHEAANEAQPLPEEQIAEQAKGVWETGATNRALDLLDQGIQDHPQALMLYKLRGDILATSRGAQEAVRCVSRKDS
jgi:hypothetical protein